MANYNIAQKLGEVARLQPQALALIAKRHGSYRPWSFQELERIRHRYAHGLSSAGIGRGDRVMLMVKPSLEFVALTFALFSLGAVVILIDPGMGYRNLLRCIGQVRPEILIGIPKALLFKRLFPKPFRTVRTAICVGVGFGLLGRSLARLAAPELGEFPVVAAGREELAAIIFTTGSTGPPKGVRYSHGVFQAQLELIRDHYGITAKDVDQPAFPLFALFSTALGACAVIPEMNAAQPARLDPEKFVSSLLRFGVTYSFGSPAIWNVVSRYCQKNNLRLPLKKILMAGAPVSGELLQRLAAILPAAAEIHIPYGATESLPIASITGAEVLAETWSRTRQGQGACVGRSLPGIAIKIIATADEPVKNYAEARLLPVGEVGEIIVQGPVVTAAYEENERETLLAKIKDGERFWHRLGDLGYFDKEGRLWFCGRKGQRVVTAAGPLYTICCEAIFNEHPAVSRSALVGVGRSGEQTPVVIVELQPGWRGDRLGLFRELGELGRRYEHTRAIARFLIHPAFPVDIRHNAKIFREKLAVWAEKSNEG